jgi:protein SCO1
MRFRGPRFMVAVVSCWALAACSGGGMAASDLQGVPVEDPTPKPEFTLTDTEGRPYDFADETRGELTLLYFGYTHCPDICPVHLAQIAETFDQIPEVASATEMVFVTVDPERDTPQILREFLDNFDSRFVGLTGTTAELESAQEAVGVTPAFKEGEGDDYTVQHAGQVFAWAADGLLYAEYPFGTRQQTWVNDLALLAEIEAAAR